MQRLVRAAAGVLVLAAAASAAAAQDSTMAMDSTPAPKDEGFFGKPAFVLMPSVVLTPVLSGVGDNAGDTKAYFNARFMTVIPTKLPWFQLVAGTQWLVNGPHDETVRANQPNIFYGAIIPFAPITKATDGWVSLSIDPLGLYQFGGGGGSRDIYGHEFWLEGAAVFNVGAKMMTNMGFFSKSSVFVLLDQQITHPPTLSNGDTDRWNPVVVAGFVIPVGQ